MRHISFALCLFILSLSNTQAADESSSPSLALGVQGGVSFANAQTPSNISSSTKTGFMGGLSLQLKLTQVFSLQPELLYVQRGTHLVDSGGVKATLRQDSIELPLLVRASFGGPVSPYIFMGPVPIFNVSNTLEADIGGNTGSINYDPKSSDLAATLGVGIALGPVFSNLRYSLGLIDTDNASSDWKSRGVQFLLGITFG